jgi:hypothetical protein
LLRPYPIEALDQLLLEEVTLRETRRIKAALMLARLTAIKTLASGLRLRLPAATALLDRLLHHAVVIQIEGSSYRLRQHGDLVPEHVRSKATVTPETERLFLGSFERSLARYRGSLDTIRAGRLAQGDADLDTRRPPSLGANPLADENLRGIQ